MGCGASSEATAVEDKPADAAAPSPADPEKPTANGLPTLLPQPDTPAGTIIMLECRGGTDKKADGHRGDTIPISNALIEKGWACIPMYYSDEEYDTVYDALCKAQGFIARVNPGAYEGVTQKKLDDMLRDVASKGVKAMAHPDCMIKMGAKDALVKINDLSCGLPDTYAYYDIPGFKEGFPKALATGHVRVLKQNRGSQGEGIWVCKLKEGESKDSVTGSTMLDLQEAFDNHKEEKTVDDFMSFCEQYIVGDQGQLVDQRFLPRIIEGELRVNMIYDTPTEIIHKKPAEGGISTTLASGAKYVTYGADDPQFATMMAKFKADLPVLMKTLGLENDPLPLVWTADFILGDKDESGNDTYIVGEFNCSCVGITQQLCLAPTVADAAIKICQG